MRAVNRNKTTKKSAAEMDKDKYALLLLRIYVIIPTHQNR